MISGTLSFAEFGILLVALFPWLAGIAVAIVGLLLLRRLVHANERIARASEAKRREG